MKVYLSGPMTGLPDHNKETFVFATTLLRKKGHEVISPDEMSDALALGRGCTREDIPYLEYIREDLIALFEVQAVVLLPGWGSSKGCAIEVSLARAIGLRLFLFDPMADDAMRQLTTADEAREYVHGPRQATYGHPRKNFGRIGMLWAADLKGVGKLPLDKDLSPEDVARLLMLLKLARLQQGYHRDSAVDVTGYDLTLEMIAED